MLDFLQAPNHAGPQEGEGVLKCGSDAMLLADTKKQVIHLKSFTTMWAISGELS